MKLFNRYFGYILLISAFFRIIPITTGLIYHEPINSFLISAAVSIILGAVFLWIGKHSKEKEDLLTLSQALMLVALSFVVIPLIGSISFLESFNYNLLNAYFEAISGITTTGLTLFSSLEGIPKSLLLWRAEMQWMGGIGIIMVFIFIASRLKFHANGTAEASETAVQTTSALYQAQGFPQKLEPGLRNTTRNILIIYGTYTLLGIISLYFVGMSLYESIGMSFTSLSTGGFVLSDTPFANNAQLVVLSILMILGAISFIAHNKIIQKKFKEFFLYPDKNILFVFIIAGILLTFTMFTDLRIIIFELISSFTTTGYSITNISLLPHLFIMVIMIGMIIGGCIASTSGGIKVTRVYYLLKMIPWMLKKLASPAHAVIPFRVHKKVMENKDIVLVSLFVFTYILILIIGTVIFMILGQSFLDSSFQVTSALGTVGLQTMKLGSLHWIGKSVLMICMLFGRLEIFPMMILLRQFFLLEWKFWKKK